MAPLPPPRFVTCSLLLLFGGVAAVQTAEVKPPPMPPGALWQLGSKHLLNHGAGATVVALSPDGAVLATGGSLPANQGENFVKLWHVASGQERYRCTVEKRAVNALTFSADGKVLAAGTSDGSISLIDPSNGQISHQLKGHGAGAVALSFAADGKTLFSASAGAQDKTLRAWEVASGMELRNTPWTASTSLQPFAFAPDGKLLATGGSDGALRLWDTTTGNERVSVVRHRQRVASVAFAPSGETVATASTDGTIRLWNVADGKEISRISDPVEQGVDSTNTYSFVTFSADGRTVIAHCHASCFYRQWDVASGKELRQLQLGERNATLCAYAPASQTLVLSKGDGKCRVWDMETARERSYGGHSKDVVAVAYAPDSQTVATGGNDNTVRLWQTSTGKEIACLKGHVSRVKAIAFSSDGKLVASATDRSDLAVSVWDVGTGQEVHQLRGTQGGINALTFTADHKLVSIGGDGVVRTWDVAGGKEVAQSKIVINVNANANVFGGANQAFYTIAPDGRSVAAGMRFANVPVVLWDVASGKEGRKLTPPEDMNPNDNFRQFRGTGALALAPDGRTLAVSTWNQIHEIWDLTTGKRVRKFPDNVQVDPNNPFYFIPTVMTFSPDGRTLAAVGNDGKDRIIRLWETATGKERGRFVWGANPNGTNPQVYGFGGQTPDYALAFAPDGRTLTSALLDTMATVWDVTGRSQAGKPLPAELTAKDLSDLQADLSGPDAAKAFRALWNLTAFAKQTVPVLKARLQPIAAMDAQRVQQLIKDLDHKDFVMRNQASEELEKLSELVGPELEQALANKPPLEVVQRLEGLIQKLRDKSLTNEQVRAFREMEVLEKIATDEAQAVVESVAKGAPGARVTQEAQSVLQRMSRRMTRMP